MYEGAENNYLINNLDSVTIYEIRICTSYNNIKSQYSKIFKIQTDLDSIILKGNEKRKEYINKLVEWSGFKSMKLLYRGTRDGMTS